MKRIIVLLAAALALVVSACTSEGASPTPEASEPVATATATPEATPETSEPSTPSEEPAGPGESQFAIPSFDLDGDPELAGRFPDSVGGQQLQVISMRGDAFMGAGDDPAFDEFLESVGAEYEDVSVAFGGSTDGTIGIAAFRIAGADEGRLEEEFLAANEETGDIVGATRRSVGGKEVWTAESTEEAVPGSVYIYVQDDTVYFMTAPGDDVAAEILEALP